MDFTAEIKRKLFHHLSVLYILIYWILPRWAALTIMTIAMVALAAIEFIRLRRPEVNEWFLKKFGGIHRPEEIMAPSGIFWTLLGCWATMVIFAGKRVVLPALGFLAFGDTAAALAGLKWGTRPWKHNITKTIEGSAAMVVVCFAWALLFVRWPVAFLSGVIAAWIESRPMPYNDNLWVPLLSALAVSILNLVLGRY